MIDHRFHIFPFPDPKLKDAKFREGNWIDLDIVDVAVCQTRQRQSWMV